MARKPGRLFGVLGLCVLAGALAGASPAMAAPPPNDNFANATVLASGTSATITGTNVEATTESGEPLCCFIDKTVWYRWTAPKTGKYRVDLCASNFNTFLKVFKGTAVNALENVAESNNDPGCGPDGSRSRLTFVALAGQRYELQMGSNGGSGAGTISGSIALVSPANDSFADATGLVGATAAIMGTNVDATTESGEPPCCSSTVWYRWTAPATGNYRVELCGSSFNTFLKVFKGTALNGLANVAENNNDPGCGSGGDRSRLTFAAAANTTTYYIQIGSAAVPAGTIAGSISPAAAPPPRDTVAPRVSRLKLSRRTFAAHRSGPSVRGARARGTRVSYRISEAATVTFRVQRVLAGRRVRGRCVKATRANRAKRRCKRYRTLRGSFRHTGTAGANRFTFTGRLAGRSLRPGRYRLLAAAKDAAANKSRPVRKPFRIIR